MMIKNALLFVLGMLFTNLLLAQISITGKVTSADDGSNIPYANIQVKGDKTKGTVADAEGKFTLEKISSTAILTISYIGYSSKEVPVRNQSVINVVLEKDILNLDEVMVVAYGTARKSTFTGSASTVNADAIKDIPSTSFENALAGNVPGLQLSRGSGQVGSSVSIRIRGTGSMNASNEPLYVIDGVPVVSGDVSQLSNVTSNALSSLNPNDIQSITVLKDAAASALYGSRAANGVVVITTKMGRRGKTNITLRNDLGFTPDFAYHHNEKASPEQQRELRYETYYNGQINSGKTDAEARAYTENLLNLNLPVDPRGIFDWEDAIFRTGVYRNHDLSFSGGDEKSTYFSSVSYSKEDGMVRANGLDRLSGRLNMTNKLNNWLSLGTNVSFSSVKKKGYNDTNNNGDNYLQMQRNLVFGDWFPTKQDGSPVTTRFLSYGFNVLYYDQLRDMTSVHNKLTLNETITIDIARGLSFKSIFAYTESRIDDYSWRSAEHYGGTSKNGTVDQYNTTRLSLVSSNTLNYNQSFNNVHNLRLLAGFEAEKTRNDFTWAGGSDLPSGMKTVSAAGKKDAGASYTGSNLLSYFTFGEYNYDNRYYVSGSLRRDGSSRLGANSRWGNFGSVAASWRLKEEAFLRDVDWLSNLRLKFSYGINGTLPSSFYGHMPLYNYGSNYNEKPGGFVSTVADPDLSWETSYTYNVGMEAGFINNRLYVGVEYYNRDSRNLLQNVPISTVTGFSNILTNIGVMNNQGIEIELKGEIIRKNNFTWTLGANASTLNSKITKLYEGMDIIWYDPTGGDNQAKFIYREGESPKSFWGKEWAGVDPENGKAMWYTNNTTATPYKKWNDRDVTTSYSAASDIITGVADPKLFGGINSNLAWKGFNLDLHFIYSLGGDIYNSMGRYMNDDGYFSWRTLGKDALDRWQKPGDVAQNPKRIYDEGFENHTSRWLYRNDFLRLKSITFGYNLPKELISRASLSNVRVYFAGLNIFTVGSQKIVDPEVNSYGTTFFQLPLGKTYSFGLEIGL